MEGLVQLIPLGELAPGQAGAIRNKVIDGLVQQACRELKMVPAQLVVRDIRPTDIGFTYQDFRVTTGTTVNAYESTGSGVSGTSADQTYIGIFGVKDDGDNHSVSAVKFNVGGGDRAIWMLEQLNKFDDYVGFSPSAIVIPQTTPYIIYKWVRSISSTNNICFKGVIVEPRGKVVSP